MAVARVGKPPKVTPIQEKILAFERQCRDDFEFACNRVLWIKPKDAALCRLQLNWPQQYIWRHYVKPRWDAGEPIALAILKPRREGISTLSEAWLYHKIRWYSGQSAVVVAHRDDTVDELHQMVLRFHNQLPPELQPPTERHSRKELAYATLDSRIRVLVAGYLDIGRGKTIQHCHGSEVAWWPDPSTIMAGLNEAVYDRGRSTLILESTANSVGDWWHNLWDQIGKTRGRAFGDRQWQRAFLPWFVHPDHQTPMPPHFWDTVPEDEAKELREMQRRFRLIDAQLCWYHHKLQEQELLHPGMGKRVMKREYPAHDIEAFQAAGTCIFVEAAMERMEALAYHPQIGFRPYRTGTYDYQLIPCPPDDGELLVWEAPTPGYEYAIGVDTSGGVGRDDAAICVLRMPGFHQVALWESNIVDPKSLAYLVAAVARYYAQAGARPVLVVEINNMGILTNSELMEIGWREPYSLFTWERMDTLGTQPVTPNSRTGWVTNFHSKDIMVGQANFLLANALCEIPSRELLADMRQTVEIRWGVYRTTGADATMAWLLAVVGAWRKIARWQLGMPRQQTLHAQQGAQILAGDVVFENLAQMDKTGVRLLNPQPLMGGLGDMNADWRLQ